MKSTTVNFNQTPLETQKIIQFLTTPEMWDKDRITDFEEWCEAYQLLITKIRRGEFDLPMPDSTQMIGQAKERYDQLERKDFDWHSWYNGWMEGRFNLLGWFLK
jgi:hypothetical protein